jgi:acyl-CoA reductase-like NAD-dependent aldehyde dehydrogenase
VFDDVSNLDKVADAVVQSALRNQGQVCVAHTRVISNRRVKEALLESIVDRARRYRLGDPLDISTTFGPLASAVQRDRVKGYIRQALDAGAEARLLGDIRESGGYYVAPTIFDRVSSDMSVVSEEIFGPVLCVQEFTADEEAVALANGTDYGLAATVWTRDMGRAKRLAHAIRAGSISVHTSGEDGPVPEYLLSHEPQKASGFGAEFGTGGMIAYSVLKSITFEGG